MPLTYPKKFTDADWKAQEKKIKVSATGIGKTLREFEAAVKHASTEIDHPKDFATIDKEMLKLKPFIKKSADAISGERNKATKAKNAAAEKYLLELHAAVEWYGSELDSFVANLANKHLLKEKIGDYVKRFNDRVLMR